MRRLLADRETDGSEVMAIVAMMRADAGHLGDDAPDYEPQPTRPETAP
jgi:hypothetical protein